MDESLGTGTENKTPLYISIAALALALLALLFAFNARGKAKALEEKLAGFDTTKFVTKEEHRAESAMVAKLADVQAVGGEFQTFKADVINHFGKLAGAIEEQNRAITSMAARSAAPTRTTATTGNAGATAAPVAAAGEYVIKSGDTFAKIARANGVNLADLAKANPGVDAGKLKVGQKIKLPAKK